MLLSQLEKLSDADTLDEEEREATRKLHRDLYGAIATESLPDELADELLRQQANVPHHLWRNPRLYPARVKGRLRAAQIVKNQLELVSRAHDAMRRNREAALAESRRKAKGSK